MKIGIFTGATSVRSKNIFTDISRYPTGKHGKKKTRKKTHQTSPSVQFGLDPHCLQTVTFATALFDCKLQSHDYYEKESNLQTDR